MKRPTGLRVVVLAYLGVIVALPVGYLIYRSFSKGFSSFMSQVTQPGAVHALVLSLEVAAIAVPLNTIVGVGAALLFARHRFWGHRVLDLCFDIPVAVSPVIIGVALVLAYSKIGWWGSWLATQGISVLFSVTGIVLATTAVSLPYVLRSTLPVLLESGTDQEEAARTLGSGPLRTFWYITLPVIRWGVLYGVVLTLARTLGEFGAVVVVSGNISGLTQTLPIYIYDSWDQNYNAQASFDNALILAAIAVVALVVLGILRSKERNHRGDLA